MQNVIRHNKTKVTILAYLALYDVPINGLRIREYCKLMHNIAYNATELALIDLKRTKQIQHVTRSYYRGFNERST